MTAPREQTVWMTSSVPDNGVRGFGLCLKEEARKIYRNRVLDNWNLDPKSAVVNQNSAEMKTVFKHDLSMNHFRDGVWGTVHHIVSDSSSLTLPYGKSGNLSTYNKTEHAFIKNVVSGDLSSLKWHEGSGGKYMENLKPDEELCAVYYSSLNFRDVMFATGKLPPDTAPPQAGDSVLGIEFSGRLVGSGKRIFGIRGAESMATYVPVRKDMYWECPDDWTLEEAATVPVVYTTVYISMIMRGGLKKGESVLIHSGTGGVGISAINIALSIGAEVFCSVSSEEKKQILLKLFPRLKPENFTASRSDRFEFDIMKKTKGQGVDMIINSLADKLLRAGIRCLRYNGRFIEIGKYDLTQDTPIGMGTFLKNTTIHGINTLDRLADPIMSDTWEECLRLFSEGIKSGVVKPLPCTVFDSDKVEDAFRYMGTAKHIGKVVLRIRDEEPQAVCMPPQMKVTAVCRTICHPDHVYLITGGLGGFGLELAGFLIERGARKIVLTSRSGVKTGYQARCIGVWREKGTTVEVLNHDIADSDQCRLLIEACQAIGTLGGIFHLAMVLRDQLFENQNPDNFKDSAQAKYYGTKNLDRVTRELCDQRLKWFVVFSSVACGRGHEGQSNYGWANGTMERVIEKRRHDGFSGMAVQWGAVGDTGVVLETLGDNSTVVGGTLPQRMVSCLQTLDIFLQKDHPVVASFVRAETRRTKTATKSGDVITTIARILGLNDASSLDPNALLGDLGLDSLMGVEIRQALERDYDIILSMKDIRTLTLNKLKALVQDGGGGHDREATEEELLEFNPVEFFGLRMDPNSMMPSSPLIQMNEASVSSSYKNTTQPLFCVHSIEGISSTLTALANTLPLPAYSFQCTPQAPINTIESLAAFYLKEMRKVQASGPYRLLGYSFGAHIAYEIAVQVEASGDSIEHLVLLDSSHAFMQVYRNVYRAQYNVTTDLADNPVFEAEILCGYTMRFVHMDYAQFRSSLLAMGSFQERLEHVVETVMESGLFADRDTCRFSALTLYEKYQAADRYRFDGKEKLKCNITLVKASKSSIKLSDLGPDYGLGKVCSGEVSVHVVEGDHDSFIHSEAELAQTSALVKSVLQL